MTKISNQYSLTNILTADLANSRLGINNVSPTVALDVTGAGKFSGVLTLGSTISNGTLTYTLPSATGTLALTSALSGYLPLTGGTLTGALNGTSVTTSDIIQTNKTGGLVYRAYYGSGNNRTLDVNIDTSNGDAQLTWNTTYNSGWKYYLNNYAARIATGDGIYFSVAANGTAGNTISWINALSITSTGAATFSSSVGIGISPINKFTVNTGTNNNLDVFDNGTGIGIQSINNGNTAYRPLSMLGSSLSFTGAATFSSSVLTGDDITVSKSGDSGINLNSTTTNGVAVTRYKTTAAGSIWATGINITNADSRWEVYNFTLGASPFRISNAGVTTINGDGASLVYQAKTVNADLYLEMKNSAGSRRGYIGYGGASSALFEISNSENGAIDFRTNAAFAMRITSGGNIGIRTTTPVGKLHIVTTGNSFTPTETGIIGGNNNYRVHIQSGEPGIMLTSDLSGAGSATGTQTYQLGLQIGYVTTNDVRSFIYFGNSVLSFMYSGDQGSNGSERMRISTNGSIGAPNGTNIYNASDARLKQNVSTTTYGLNTISLLNPVKFNWVDGFEPTEDGKDMLGFVAQEVQNIIPEAVESFGGNSITIGDTIIDNPLRVNEKFIIPVLVKAIQELSAKVSLLENK